jgi:hypothetical protein
MITGSGGLLSADDSVAHQAGWLPGCRFLVGVGNNDAFFAASQKKVVCVLFFPRPRARARRALFRCEAPARARVRFVETKRERRAPRERA